jgi:crotonobetaine/carnitine-CoA ligase
VAGPGSTDGSIRVIPQLVDDAAREHGDRPWLVTDDVSFSFVEAQRATRAVAAALAGYGVAAGDIVLLVAHNTPHDVLAWLGILRLGAIALPVNPQSTVAELTGFLDQVRPRLVVHDPVADAALRDAFAAAAVTPRVVALGDLFTEPDGLVAPAQVAPRDPAVLIPTSGTTGRSKLVTQTHQGYVLAAEGFPYWLGLTAEDRLITALPIFHINAPAYSLLGSMAVGASVVLLPRYSPSSFLDATRRHGATECNMIGAMLEMLMRQPERSDDVDNPLRVVYTGPSPERDRQLEIERRFGVEIVCGYALSESTYGTVWRHGTRPYGTLGAARQHPTLGQVNEARVMHDGAEVACGETGELELRNPAIMLGYHEMPGETAEVIVDGWLRTGDLVVRNSDDTFTFVARKKEVIRRRGENLAPGEVEDALVALPEIVDAAVIAVPAELGEDEVKAFVVVREGAVLDPAETKARLLERLARFKVPRYVEVLADDLPRTPTGRVAKHRLPVERTESEIDLEAMP